MYTITDFETFLGNYRLLEKGERAEWVPKEGLELELAEKMVGDELSGEYFTTSTDEGRRSIVVTKIRTRKGVRDESNLLFNDCRDTL